MIPILNVSNSPLIGMSPIDSNSRSNGKGTGPASGTRRADAAAREHGERRTNMIILLVIAAIAVSLPMAGIVVVSLASRREDAAHSLSGRGLSGAIQIAARRVVGFHGAGLHARRLAAGAAAPVRDAAGPMTATSPASWPATCPRTGGSRPSRACPVTAAPAGAAVTASGGGPGRAGRRARTGRLVCRHASRALPAAGQLRSVRQPGPGRGGGHQRRRRGGRAGRLSRGHAGPVLRRPAAAGAAAGRPVLRRPGAGRPAGRAGHRGRGVRAGPRRGPGLQHDCGGRRQRAHHRRLPEDPPVRRARPARVRHRGPRPGTGARGPGRPAGRLPDLLRRQVSRARPGTRGGRAPTCW